MPLSVPVSPLKRYFDDPDPSGIMADYIFEAIKAGASGYLLKEVELVELVRAVRSVALAPNQTGRRSWTG